METTLITDDDVCGLWDYIGDHFDEEEVDQTIEDFEFDMTRLYVSNLDLSKEAADQVLNF